jgi:hypothetical protein
MLRDGAFFLLIFIVVATCCCIASSALPRGQRVAVGAAALRLHMNEHIAHKIQVPLSSHTHCCARLTNLLQRVYDEEFQMRQDRLKRRRESGPVAFHAISASAAAAAAALPTRGQMSLSSFLTKKPPRAMEMAGASNCKRNEILFHAAAEAAEQERGLLSPSRPTLTWLLGKKRHTLLFRLQLKMTTDIQYSLRFNTAVGPFLAAVTL